MATQVAYQERNAALNRLVSAWERRWRLQRTLWWLPRALLPALLIGSVLLLIGRTRPLLNNAQVLALTGALLAVGLLALVGMIWLRGRSSIEAARSFDLQFGLGERVSTALELLDGRIHANDELTVHQLEDAWSRAQGVQPGEKLPLRHDWKAWLGVGLALVLFTVLFLLPN